MAPSLSTLSFCFCQELFFLIFAASKTLRYQSRCIYHSSNDSFEIVYFTVNGHRTTLTHLSPSYTLQREFFCEGAKKISGISGKACADTRHFHQVDCLLLGSNLDIEEERTLVLLRASHFSFSGLLG